MSMITRPQLIENFCPRSRTHGLNPSRSVGTFSKTLKPFIDSEYSSFFRLHLERCFKPRGENLRG